MKAKKTLGRPPGSSSEETRARILAAARRAFANTGYASTTNRDIAGLAGLTAAAIYQYFDSKMALYLATVADASEALLQRYRRTVAEATTARQALRGLLLVSTEIHAHDPSLADFLSAMPVEMRRHPELSGAIAGAPSEVVQLFDKAVALGVKTGEISRAEAPRVVGLFVACSMGLSLFAASIPGSNLGQAIETFVQLIDGKLFKKAAAPKRARATD